MEKQDNAIISIYCDESCHLPNDKQTAMVLGAVSCPENSVQHYNNKIAELKTAHGLSKYYEMKWSKISSGKLAFYVELIALFFDSDDLGFRTWVIPDKSILSHSKFGQSHDDWYYKMYFYLLRNMISSERKFHIYLDIKDTRSRQKLQKLNEVLCNANYDFSRDIIARMQHVHSHDIGLMQMADILIGAVSYHARGISSSPAKSKIVELIKTRSGLSLNSNSLPNEKKFNMCIWRPNSFGGENA
ncbi:DUF3800 domain-containing protein [bacterium]|nr:MAG: DUF3800 domain-containing protein [bacterium]